MKNPRPSLAEAPLVDADARKILKAAEEASKYRDLDLGAEKDAIAFAQTLAVERARRTDLPESLPEAILIICDERLVELRKAASAIVEAWRETYREGRALVAQAEYDGLHMFEMLEKEREHGIDTARWRRLVGSLFPRSQPHRALANLLAVVEAKFHGICPKASGDAWGKFWGGQFRKVGGAQAVQAYLSPPRHVVSAVVCLYLCESGVNSDVALRMKPNAVRPSQRPRHIIVTGRKARARNRAIYSELPLRRTVHECMSAAEALLFYTGAVRLLRDGHDDLPLFIHVARTGSRHSATGGWPRIFGLSWPRRSILHRSGSIPRCSARPSFVHRAAQSRQAWGGADARAAQTRYDNHGLRPEAPVPDGPRAAHAPVRRDARSGGGGPGRVGEDGTPGRGVARGDRRRAPHGPWRVVPGPRSRGAARRSDGDRLPRGGPVPRLLEGPGRGRRGVRCRHDCLVEGPRGRRARVARRQSRTMDRALGPLESVFPCRAEREDDPRGPRHNKEACGRPGRRAHGVAAVQGAAAVVRTQPKAAAKQVTDRLFALTRYPWLESVSDDRTLWVVRDLVGQRGRTAKIDLNIEFPDGTRLTDPVNRALFEVAVEYVELVRLYQPGMSAETHRSRVTRLLVFIYWLIQRGVRSLNEVTQDHLALFLRDAEFGTEWVLGMPQRLVGFLQREVRSGRELPRKGNGRIDLRKEFPRGRIHRLDTPSSKGPCFSIARWFETRHGELDTKASPEELIDRMGWKPKPRVGKHIGLMVKPIEELWAWRDDFLSDVEAAGLAVHGITDKARRRGAELGHYATIPPEVAFAYLRGALRWVVVFAPVFLEGRRRGWSPEETVKRLARAGLDVVLRRPAPGARAGPVWVTPDRFVRLTASACFAVIAGLSARRLGEIMDLGAGCTFVDMDGHHWIRIYIEKTLRRYEQMPVPAAVHQAVECLEEISAEAREETGDDSLWQYVCRYKRRCARLQPSRELNNLSQFLGGDLHECWNFHPHQFRRFFAMLYFWRYEPGDVAALAHHLRHFDLEMTRQYVTDDGFSRIWQDVAEERQRDVLASVVDGSRWVGGPAGEQLKARIETLRRRYRRDVQVVPSERIVEKLLRLAKKWGSACKWHVWGTICVCPQKGSPDQGRHAHCKGAKERGPVFSQATVATCARCPYAVHTERFEPGGEGGARRSGEPGRGAVGRNAAQGVCVVQLRGLEESAPTRRRGADEGRVVAICQGRVRPR